MNPGDELERRLRASFGDLRRADERNAPPFERTWQAAAAGLSRRTPAPAPRLARLAASVAAVAAVGVVGVVVGILNNRPGRDRHVAERPGPAPSAEEPQDQEATVSIVDWQSPTAGLLEPSAEEWSPAGRGNF